MSIDGIRQICETWLDKYYRDLAGTSESEKLVMEIWEYVQEAHKQGVETGAQIDMDVARTKAKEIYGQNS